MAILDEFLISLGFRVDEGSARKAESVTKRVEDQVSASDQRVTRGQIRQASIRALHEARSVEGRVKAAQMLETVDTRAANRVLRLVYRRGAAEAVTAQERVKWLTRQRAVEEEMHARSVKGIRSVTNAAVGAATLIQTASVALNLFAQRAAEKLEAMAYASDRTRSSVSDLKAFSAAVAQLGGTAGGALNDLENFAGELRKNPRGYANFLKSVGVNAFDAKGQIRGAVDLYREFRAEVGKKPYETQMLYAQEMGISEQTWRATDPAKMAEQERQQRERYGRMNFNPDAAKDDAVKLQQSWRDMWDTVGIIADKTVSQIFAKVGGNLEKLTQFLERNGDRIAEILGKVAQIVLAVAQAFIELATSDKVKGFLDWLLSAFGKVDEGSGQWVADIDKIKLAMEALAVFIAGVFVAKIRGAIKDVVGDLKPFLALLAPFMRFLGGPVVGPVGSAIGADLAVPNAEKPALQKNWDDEASGGAGGGTTGGMIGRGARKLWNGAKSLLGMGAEAKEGGGAPPGQGGMAPLSKKQLDIGKGSPEVEAYIRKKAAENGIDPDTAVAVANAEALRSFDPNKPDGGGDSGSSFGPYQLHYGGIAPGRNAQPGLGDVFTKQTGVDAKDSSTWKQQVDFALGYAAKNGWGSWYGARDTGIGRWQGIPADKSGGGRVGLGGSAAARGTNGVDPRLLGIIGEASKSLPDGYRAEVISGLRPGDQRFHGRGMATDVAIYDKEGKKLPNYQDEGAFRTYEKFAQDARRVQMERHPELAKAFRWGGYFGGPRGKYGAVDTMHFDIGGEGVGMGGGSWERGLTPEQRRLFPGAQSEGMGSQALGAADRLGAAAARLRENATSMAERVGQAASQLDPGQLKSFGAATQGFDPKEYFTPPASTTNTSSNDNSRTLHFNPSYHTTVTASGNDRTAADLHERSQKRMVADDLRNLSSMYATG